MDRSEQVLTGAIAGAALMYFLDPDRGARRRGLVRDKLVHLNRKMELGLDQAARDARNRSAGLAARTRRQFDEDDAPGAVVRERVRSELGRVVSHPHAIEAGVQDGRVTLAGPILADEVEPLLAATRRVRGVDEVENRLEVHESPGNVPGLQGQPRPREPRAELLQENWTPSLRVLMGGLGAVALVGGRRAAGLRGALAGAVGSALLGRAVTNLPTRRLIGVNAGREAVRFQKTLHIDAPVGEVWALWSRFENFPRFMAHLDEVRVTGEGLSHWVARGPAGTRFEWDAETTQWIAEEVIAWKSVEGATVASAGVVRFDATEDGGTRVDVHLSYNPPAGAVGHAIARMLGSDPKSAMDEDMVRLKSLLETGKASVDGDSVTREELEETEAGSAAD